MSVCVTPLHRVAVSPGDNSAEASRGGGDNQKRHCLGVVMSTVVVVPDEKKKSTDLFPFLFLPHSLSFFLCPALSLPAPASHLLGSRSAAPSARPASGLRRPHLLKENKQGEISGDAG